MHPSGWERADGISVINYKDKLLRVGHTLIKGVKDNSFINAIPTGDTSLFPRSVKEYNKEMISKGGSPLFSGIVKEGNLVLKYDYLLVMSPPKN